MFFELGANNEDITAAGVAGFTSGAVNVFKPARRTHARFIVCIMAFRVIGKDIVIYCLHQRQAHVYGAAKGLSERGIITAETGRLAGLKFIEEQPIAEWAMKGKQQLLAGIARTG
jgi:hypothetical protein